MYLVALAVFYLCRLYIAVLVIRVVFDFVQLFQPNWMPRGIVLLIARAVYILTDPPLRFLARYIPPLRLGGLALDVGFIVLYFAVVLVRSGAWALMLASR